MDSWRNEDAPPRAGNDAAMTGWEARVAGLARDFAYPPSPNLAAGLPTGRSLSRRRPIVARPAFALALILLMAGVFLLATPAARSAVVRVFQIGVARIFVTEPALPPPATPRADAASPDTGAQVPVTATPLVAATPTGAASDRTPELPSGLKDLSGLTTFAEAQQQAPFPVALPAYPPGLGAPDFVFLRQYAAPVLVLAWSDANAPGGVRLSLWMFPKETIVDKINPDTVVETTVAGRPAVWTQGRHMLYARGGNVELVRLVLGNTLIWEREDVTYRLETFLPLDEATKVAASIQ
ncbi:MAG: hypothetical protein MUC34_13440 [Anaerolineae bacterium]|nr:hypothetical protein [Anaerolineae bacterium]